MPLSGFRSDLHSNRRLGIIRTARLVRIYEFGAKRNPRLVSGAYLAQKCSSNPSTSSRRKMDRKEWSIWALKFVDPTQISPVNPDGWRSPDGSEGGEYLGTKICGSHTDFARKSGRLAFPRWIGRREVPSGHDGSEGGECHLATDQILNFSTL